MNVELEEIYKRIRVLRGPPQSAEKEREFALLDWERQEIEAYRRFKICQKARLLFKAYLQNGRMSAIHPSGHRAEGTPLTAGVSDIQAVWNLRSEAERLAEWAQP